MSNVAVFNGEKMTRREVEIARESYATALRTQCCTPPAEAYRRAIATYPLPTIVRPRVARDPHSPQCDWKVVCGCLTVRIGALPANATFQNYPRPGEAIHPTLERCKLWADLLANPNETVDDES